MISLKAQIIDMSKRPVKLKPAKCKLKVNRRKSFDLRSYIVHYDKVIVPFSVFQLGFQKGRVLILKKGTLV